MKTTPMITLSTPVQEHFVRLLANQPDNTGIRLFVSYPGTPSAECGLIYCQPDSVTSNDLVIECGSFRVYIDPELAPFLKETHIDLIDVGHDLQVTFDAPYARKSATETSLSAQINHLLATEINPQLAQHGGAIALVEITADKYAVMKFSGGCSGCAMAKLTLKDGVTKTLLSKIPELKGIEDATDHQPGRHSYY